MKVLSICLALVCALGLTSAAQAQQGPLRITIEEGIIKPLPFAVPNFQAETGEAGQLSADLARVIAADLQGTGVFTEIPSSAFIAQYRDFNAPISFPDWRAINAQALVTGAVSVTGNSVSVKFRVYDVVSGTEIDKGLQFAGTVDGWRRMAHKVADEVYSRITGEGGYFDSRVVYVSETGPKDDRQKRLAVMDYDGANVRYLTDSSSIVLAPRFSPVTRAAFRASTFSTSARCSGACCKVAKAR